MELEITIDGMFEEFTQVEVDIDDINEMAEEDGSDIEDYLTSGYDAGSMEIFLDRTNSLRIYDVKSKKSKTLYDEYLYESECVSITKDGNQDSFKRKNGKAYLEIGNGFRGTAYERNFEITGEFNPKLLKVKIVNDILISVTYRSCKTITQSFMPQI